MIMPNQNSKTLALPFKNEGKPYVNVGYEYTRRSDQTVTQQTLAKARYLCDIAPKLWARLVMSQSARVDLDHKVGKQDGQEYSYKNLKEEAYTDMLEYTSVEISVVSDGKVLSSKNKNDELTNEQRNYLLVADPGTNVNIHIKFRYKDAFADAIANESIDGSIAVTVVPENEAEYPGGLVKLNEYFYKKTTSPTPEISAYFKKQPAIIEFTVNKEGKAGAAKIVKTSGDPRADELLLKAVDTMPDWKPAENWQGEKTEQKFFIPFWSEGC